MRTNGKSQNVLPVDEATVQERQVTVQVLTIGTKQVTQALYKQLVEKDIRREGGLIDPYTGKIQGTVWGWVNLHNDCWFGVNDHLHVVWESDGELKKSCVYLPWTTSNIVPGPLPSYYTKLIDRYDAQEGDDGASLERQIDQARENWEQSYQDCLDAGQLFIAVSGVWK